MSIAANAPGIILPFDILVFIPYTMEGIPYTTFSKVLKKRIFYVLTFIFIDRHTKTENFG